MNFKKQTSILLSIFLLISHIGYTLTVHYCNNNVAAVSLNMSTIELCDKPTDACCAAKTSKKSCCSNKIIKIDKNKDNFLSKVAPIQLLFVVFNPFNITFNSIQHFVTTSIKIIFFYRNSNAPPLYKLNCQLVFYA